LLSNCSARPMQWVWAADCISTLLTRGTSCHVTLCTLCSAQSAAQRTSCYGCCSCSTRP
jgi:hypothetical protein